jgi:hypothetical protein
MDFPGSPRDWTVLPVEVFTVADVDVGEKTGVYAEMYAILRDNGRIQDDFRVAFGDKDTLEYTVDGRIFSTDKLNNIEMKLTVWARDLEFKLSSAATKWSDWKDLIKSRTVLVYETGMDEPKNETDIADFLMMLEADQELGAKDASIRWILVIGDDKKPELQLQALPASADEIDGKPALKW